MSSFFGATASAPSSRSSNPFSFASLSSTSKRRSYPLPTRAPFNRTNSGSSDHREGSIRIKLLNILSKPVTGWIALLAVLSLVVCWGIGVGSGVSGRERGSGGRRVIARDWRNLPELQLDKRGGIKPDQTILILCPMKNSIEHIWHFFHMIDSLTYPRHLIEIAVLVSDSTDRTYERAIELADDRQYHSPKSKRYGRISVFRKDFADEQNAGGGAPTNGVGKQRHEFGVQVARRKLLAVSRTWLLNSAMTPEVDWVLWMDVDVVDYEKDMVQTLLEWSEKEVADVVVPNCVWKTYNEMGSYDRNNWAETPASLEMKANLAPDAVLIEGYEKNLKTYRLNMADMYPITPSTPDSMLLDGVGGCTALVRAGLHRQGAVFPAWPVDHQLETEGFAQLAKMLGGKLIGLPKYYVYHGLYG